MTGLNQEVKQKYWVGIKIVFLLVCLTILFFLVKLSLGTSTETNSPNEAELGEKIIVILPSGKEVYTYENLVVYESGKLYYKGDRSEIDLTGGIIKYEDWE